MNKRHNKNKPKGVRGRKKKLGRDRVRARKTVLHGVLQALTIATEVITVWQFASAELKSAIRAAIELAVTQFVDRFKSAPADEQIVQCGRLIEVLRVMSKTLNGVAVPTLQNILTKQVVKIDLSEAIIAGLSMPAEQLPLFFHSLRDKWAMSAVLSVRKKEPLEIVKA